MTNTNAIRRAASAILLACATVAASAAFALPAVKCTVSKGDYYGANKITWPKVSGARYYRIYRGTSPYASKCHWLANAGQNVSTAWDKTASPAVRYYYFVLPVDSNGTGYYHSDYYDMGFRDANGTVSQSATEVGVGKDSRLYMRINGKPVKPTSVQIAAGNSSGKVYLYSSLNSAGSFGFLRGYKSGDTYLRVTYHTQSALIRVRTRTPAFRQTPSSSINLNGGKAGFILYCDGAPVMPTYQYTIGTSASLTRYNSLTPGGSLGYVTPKSTGETTFVFTYYGNTIYSTVNVARTSGLEFSINRESISPGITADMRLTYNGTAVRPTSGTIKVGTNSFSFGSGSTNLSFTAAKIEILNAPASNGAFGRITGNNQGSVTLTLNYNGESITKTITIK